MIGGQSILFWCNRYNIHPPYDGALTDDVDILGTQDTVFNIAKETQGKADVSYVKQFSSLIGKVTVTRGDSYIVSIDILSKVLGVDNDDVTSLAVRSNIGDVEFFVLNPLHCLKSKITNFFSIEEKQDKYGYAQAVLSTKIAKAYLEIAIQNKEWGVVIEGVEYVHKLAQRSSGKMCAKNGINVYEAIPFDLLFTVENENFINKRLPRLAASKEEYVVSEKISSTQKI